MIITINSKLKALISQGLIYGLTSSLQNLLAFLLLPLLTNNYTPAEFGIYSIIVLLTTIASGIFSFGGSSALGRFFYEEDTKIYRNLIISTALLINFLGAILLLVISLLFSKSLSLLLFNVPAYSLHISISLNSASLGFLLNTLTLILRYEKRPWLFMFVIIIGVIINFLITYFLLINFHYGVLAPILGTFFCNCLSFFFLFLLFVKNISIKNVCSKIPTLLFFGLQTSVIGALVYILSSADKFIINYVLNISDVGVYSLGYRIGSLTNVLLIVPFSMVWAPMRMENYKSNNNVEFVSRVISYFILTGILLVLISMLFGKEIILLFFHNQEYLGAFKVFPLIMLASLFYGLQGIVDFGIYLNKKLFIYMIVLLLGIFINCILNIAFLPVFGFMASAYFSLLTYFLTTSAIFFFSNKYYKLEIEWIRISLPTLVLIIFYLLNSYSSILDDKYFIKKIFIIFLSLFLITKYWLTNDEKISLINLFKYNRK